MYRQIRKDLAFDSKEDAESSRISKASEAKRLREDIEKASKKVNEAESVRLANDAKINELDKVVSGYKPVDEEAAVEAAAAALSEKEELTDMSIQISSELKAVRAALKSVQSGAEELNRIRREHEIIDSLSRTANGMLPGKERITLESYVQSFYFERIIRRANIRLRMMSDGQYEFVRAGESGDKRHLSGLDLSVLDHYSGTERPVNTLSGGESFMASLSLALGLSDEVQASAGGIRLDTMFVDEGFGSLDSDTLEKAIRTLTELSDEDKLVGIISHVDALKTRIDKQIVVTKNRDEGSRAIVII
jgi:exonuclease SbcC